MHIIFMESLSLFQYASNSDIDMATDAALLFSLSFFCVICVGIVFADLRNNFSVYK